MLQSMGVTMKKRAFIAIVSLVFVCLTGCNQKSRNSFYTFKDSESDIAAVLFLGVEEEYEKSKEVLKDTYFKNLDDTFFDSIDSVETTGWQEIYLIVPKYNDDSITVTELIENGDQPFIKKTLITTNKPVLLKCNVSDIMPSSQVTISSNGQKEEFSPHVSLKDSSIVTAKSIFTENLVHKDKKT